MPGNQGPLSAVEVQEITVRLSVIASTAEELVMMVSPEWGAKFGKWASMARKVAAFVHVYNQLPELPKNPAKDVILGAVRALDGIRRIK